MELRIPNLPVLCAGLVCMLASATASADNATPFPGTHVIKTGHSYALRSRLGDLLATYW